MAHSAVSGYVKWLSSVKFARIVYTLSPLDRTSLPIHEPQTDPSLTFQSASGPSREASYRPCAIVVLATSSRSSSPVRVRHCTGAFQHGGIADGVQFRTPASQRIGTVLNSEVAFFGFPLRFLDCSNRWLVSRILGEPCADAETRGSDCDTAFLVRHGSSNAKRCANPLTA